jgi:hypothetical protein
MITLLMIFLTFFVLAVAIYVLICLERFKPTPRKFYNDYEISNDRDRKEVKDE